MKRLIIFEYLREWIYDTIYNKNVNLQIHEYNT